MNEIIRQALKIRHLMPFFNIDPIRAETQVLEKDVEDKSSREEKEKI